MRNIEGSRIVSLSSIAHRFGTDSFEEKHFRGSLNKSRSYSQSKLACLIFAYELQRRLERNGVHTVSMAAHPGVSSTNLGRDMSPVLRFAFPRIGQTADQGALPVLMAALDPQLKGGEYCGPDGIYGLRGQPEVTSSNNISKKKDVATRLWRISEKLTGVSYP
jgi:NAD(P)-dependent dehydrogenase (short-subunit alcohol dehydrogenase family)